MLRCPESSPSPDRHAKPYIAGCALVSPARLSAIAACAMLVACAGNPPKRDATVVAVRMGHHDRYSSDSGLLSRRMCGIEDVEVRVELSPERLDAIGRTAADSGFFSLPATLSPARSDEDVVKVISPCPEYVLDIRYRGRRHSTSWTCLAVRDDVQPAETRAVYSMVTEALEDALSRLPDSQCIHF